jgi:hypothetical protein
MICKVHKLWILLFSLLTKVYQSIPLEPYFSLAFRSFYTSCCWICPKQKIATDFSLLKFHIFLPIGWHTSGLARNSWEKKQVDACRFLNGLNANRKIVLINRKRELYSLQKLSAIYGKFRSFNCLSVWNW